MPSFGESLAAYRARCDRVRRDRERAEQRRAEKWITERDAARRAKGWA